MASIDLLDVNVWVALSAPEHVHHDRARRYWEDEALPRIAFNSQTMLGLVRVCSSAGHFGGQPLSPEESWAVYIDWRKDTAVTHLREPSPCGSILDRFVSSGLVTPRRWTDAYLAAFAVAGSMRLVSFDRDLRVFPGLELLDLGI
ncbi:MAG: TA system VapC family ribonuclease toxin [Fimbriimonadales bacterium]